MKFLVYLALLVTVWQASAQAPGDEVSRCVNQRRSYPPNTRMLMDSRNYEQLITGSSAVWQTQKVFGAGDGWRSSFGGLCAAQPRSCDFRESTPQDNWFFTQYIRYIDATEVLVNITTNFQECRLNPSCTQLYVDMYRYERNGVDATAARTTANYQIVRRIEQPSDFSGQQYAASFSFTPSGNASGFYLGFRATGTCINIMRLQVYYRISPQRTVGLVTYPEIALPCTGSSGSATAMATCAANSRNLTSLLVACFADGRCDSVATCACIPGYEYMGGTGGSGSCRACPPGQFQPYLSNSTNPQMCLSCPANSTSTQPASSVCSCDFGLSRNNDRLEDPCTRPPSSPRIAISHPPTVNGATVELCWLRSLDNGGSPDLHYNIYILESDDTEFRRVATTQPMQSDLVCDSVELNALSSYGVAVTAASGATNDPQNFTDVSVVQDRFILFYVTLCAAVTVLLPSVPTINMAVSESPTSINLTWTQPGDEVVDSYEVSFSYQGSCSGFNHTNTTTVDGTTRQYTLTGLQEFSNYTVTVVAVNDAGGSEESSENVVTMADVPSVPPTAVTAVATSPISIITQWGRVPCIDHNSDITGYTVRYSTGGEIKREEIVYKSGESERTHTATLLAPNTSYSIQVAAVTNTGTTGPFTTNITVKTSPPKSVVVFKGHIIPNHGFVLLDNIGEGSEALLCLTDLPACCRPPYTDPMGRQALGNWYFPNGTRVVSSGKQWDFHRTRGRMVVLLHRRKGGATGIYRCSVPGQNKDLVTLYVGVYTANTGNLVVSSIQFQLTSELDAATPTFTLTCTSTGGPATNVSWTSNNSAVTENSAHNITSQILANAVTATYSHTLAVTGRLVGEYECTVSNNKPSSASRMLEVVAADSPTDLTAEKLPEEPGSFRVSWTPPASSANLTGYRIYYSGANDSGSVDVGASATNITIDNRTAGVTYTITMVALSPHLPSPVVGPAKVIPEPCPIEGQLFQSCGSACPRTCAKPQPICTLQCVAGCQCPFNRVLDEVANKCVPRTECGAPAA